MAGTDSLGEVTNERDATLPRAWVVWAVGLLVYALAVFHRSSLGVAGLVAADRFGISASQLATFTMLQLLVYAGMQVPVGLLCDRFGSRSVLLVGTTLIALAQAAFAFSHSYVTALVARGFVGVGDAMTFVCVLRLVSSWFPSRRIPLVTQLTGTFGQLGAVMAAVPMTWALAHLGWTRAYLTAACASAWSPWSACSPCSTTLPTTATSGVRGCRSRRCDAACARRGRSRAPGSGSGCTSRRSSAPRPPHCSGDTPSWSAARGAAPGPPACC